jgi:hypothetical protein
MMVQSVVAVNIPTVFIVRDAIAVGMKIPPAATNGIRSMFFHIVMMQLADANDAFLARVRYYEERIRSELPYVRDYQFGRNIAARSKGFAWTVIGIFTSSADHDRYQGSILHQEMKAFMSSHITDIAVCDFDATRDK